MRTATGAASGIRCLHRGLPELEQRHSRGVLASDVPSVFVLVRAEHFGQARVLNTLREGHRRFELARRQIREPPHGDELRRALSVVQAPEVHRARATSEELEQRLTLRRRRRRLRSRPARRGRRDWRDRWRERARRLRARACAGWWHRRCRLRAPDAQTRQTAQRRRETDVDLHRLLARPCSGPFHSLLATSF